MSSSFFAFALSSENSKTGTSPTEKNFVHVWAISLERKTKAKQATWTLVEMKGPRKEIPSFLNLVLTQEEANFMANQLIPFGCAHCVKSILEESSQSESILAFVFGHWAALRELGLSLKQENLLHQIAEEKMFFRTFFFGDPKLPKFALSYLDSYSNHLHLKSNLVEYLNFVLATDAPLAVKVEKKEGKVESALLRERSILVPSYSWAFGFLRQILTAKHAIFSARPFQSRFFDCQFRPNSSVSNFYMARTFPHIFENRFLKKVEGNQFCYQKSEIAFLDAVTYRKNQTAEKNIQGLELKHRVWSGDVIRVYHFFQLEKYWYLLIVNREEKLLQLYSAREHPLQNLEEESSFEQRLCESLGKNLFPAMSFTYVDMDCAVPQKMFSDLVPDLYAKPENSGFYVLFHCLFSIMRHRYSSYDIGRGEKRDSCVNFDLHPFYLPAWRRFLMHSSTSSS